MKILKLKYVLHGLAIISLAFSAAASADHGRSKAKKHRHAVGLVKEVRAGTRLYRDETLANSGGWFSTVNCVAGPDEGAMGIHYVDGPAIFDEAFLDPRHPESLIYEMVNGRLKLVGVEFIVIAEDWDEAHLGGEPPALMGQLFHYIGAPNRYRLPAVYALHVWAWKHNPHGMFVHWNPRVSCDEYAG